MQVVFTASIISAFGVVCSVAQAQTAPSMTVFVTASKVEAVSKITSEQRKQFRAAVKAADTNKRAVEKELKAAHGNRREKWPPEALDRYLDAEEQLQMAHAAERFWEVKPDELADSVEDIRRNLAGVGTVGRKEHVVVVDTPDEAQLIVEVDARRGDKAGTFRDVLFWLTFQIKAGPKLPAERFAAIPATYRFSRFGYDGVRLHRPRPEAPYWRFQAYGENRWAMAANVAGLLIDDFIEKNYEAMTRPGTR